MQDIEREIGSRIKAIRQKKGITQDQLSELAGLDRAHLYRLENGKQSMTLRTIKIIADALGVRVRDLVGNLQFGGQAAVARELVLLLAHPDFSRRRAPLSGPSRFLSSRSFIGHKPSISERPGVPIPPIRGGQHKQSVRSSPADARQSHL